MTIHPLHLLVFLPALLALACGEPAVEPPEPDADGGGDAACLLDEARCDGLDDDCDGVVDEGFDLRVDPQNCGACGRACDASEGAVGCAEGECVAQRDLGGGEPDPDLCPPEACNGEDDDCDGRIDEGFDLLGDPGHCGACGLRCFAPDGEVACLDGICALVACMLGRVDLDGDPETGCECMVSDERCDGVDDDCDGVADEDYDLSRDPGHCGACDHACELPGAVVGCEAGRCVVVECLPGFAEQNGDPSDGCEAIDCARGPELCNGADDDCDGAVDEDYDLSGDPGHCGACDHACELPGAVVGCEAGRCAVVECLPGFAEQNRDPSDGCEAIDCAGEPELCNGVDDDCDGAVDEDYDLGADPSHCGACGVTCADGESCEGGACG